jgi:hypothetical protein
MSDDKFNIETSRIEGLIPQQLIADSGPLIEFLKEYYKFLNQSTGPSGVLNELLSNRDLDKAVDSYVELIRKEIGDGLVKGIVADKINLFKHVSDFYQAKGSLDSFRLLFRFLFGVEIEISLPKEKILVASDGRWSQQNSIFINLSAGNAFNLTGKTVTVTSGGAIVSFEVNRVRRIGVTSNYEVFITRKSQSASITLGTQITKDDCTFTVINSLNQQTLVYGGSGFQVGQIFDLDDGTTSGTKVKVATVDGNGAITKLDFLVFGVGYSADFTARLVPESELNPGDPDVIVTTTATADQTNHPTNAIFTFANDTLAQYSGAYVTNKGFLSDDIYLQDNFFYQQYSYVIKSGERFASYENLVRKTVHPAGMKLFGEFEINNEFDLARQISLLARFYYERFHDVVETTATDFDWVFYKNLEETVTPDDTDFDWVFYKALTEDITVTFTFTNEVRKALDETVTTTSSNSFHVTKPLSESINIGDSGNVQLNPYAVNYFGEEYTEGTTLFT